MEDEQIFVEEKQVVIFGLDNEEFGVDIAEVREIIKLERITKVPDAPPFINGVINLRGKVVVIFDLAKKLHLPPHEIDKNTRIIVIEKENLVAGMLVDSATEVLRIESKDIRSAPEKVSTAIDHDYIESVAVLEERLVILLDLAKVLEADDVESAKKVSAAMSTNK